MRLVATAEALLRADRPEQLITRQHAWSLLATLLVGGALYGLVMGGHQLRPLQMLYSALKVPILLTASAAICLPSFFVVNSLLGLRADFARVRQGILVTQLTMAIVLSSLAPLTGLAYASSTNYHFATTCNGGMFLLASLASQVQLARVYRPLIQCRPRHRISRNFWLVLYVFVTIQLAWVLRPFIGSPHKPTTFLRQDVWDNAYVVVSRTVWQLLGGE